MLTVQWGRRGLSRCKMSRKRNQMREERKNRTMGMDSEKADCWNPNREGRVRSGRRCPQCKPGLCQTPRFGGKAAALWGTVISFNGGAGTETKLQRVLGRKVDSKVDIGVLQVWGQKVPTS